MAASIPSFRWAQNKEKVFLTIELPGVENGKVDIQPEEFHFRGNYQNKLFELHFRLHKPVSTEKSTHAIKGREIEVLLVKEKKESEFWPDLFAKEDHAKFKGRVHCDWNLWKDEDDEELNPRDFGMGGGFNSSAFGNSSFDDDDKDSDDEPVPGLEAVDSTKPQGDEIGEAKEPETAPEADFLHAAPPEPLHDEAARPVTQDPVPVEVEHEETVPDVKEKAEPKKGKRGKGKDSKKGAPPAAEAHEDKPEGKDEAEVKPAEVKTESRSDKKGKPAKGDTKNVAKAETKSPPKVADRPQGKDKGGQKKDKAPKTEEVPVDVPVATDVPVQEDSAVEPEEKPLPQERPKEQAKTTPKRDPKQGGVPKGAGSGQKGKKK